MNITWVIVKMNEVSNYIALEVIFSNRSLVFFAGA